jgi:hypothetical protein
MFTGLQFGRSAYSVMLPGYSLLAITSVCDVNVWGICSMGLFCNFTKILDYF